MARYWELSQLPCSDTNGSIAGQVRALDSLREMLGLMGPPAGKPEGDQPPAPNVYRAKWMREAEGETEEDDMDVEPEVEVPPTPQPKAESRPAVVHTPQTVTPAGINRPRVVEPAEPYEEPPGANFGRFQGLH